MNKSKIIFSLIVDDYDQAIDFYCSKINLFSLATDTQVTEEFRYVKLDYNSLSFNFCLNLILATDGSYAELLGKQSGNYPLLTFSVENCFLLYEELLKKDIIIDSPPESLPFGNQLTLKDPFGNKICLIEMF